jgi:MFS family permease
MRKLKVLTSKNQLDNNNNDNNEVDDVFIEENNDDDFYPVNTESSSEIARRKRLVIKNLIVLAFSYFFTFSASNGLVNIQTNINAAKNLGIYVLSISNISFACHCLVLPTLAAKYIGYKWPLVGSNIVLGIFILTNIYPNEWIILPAAFLQGAGNSILWTFQGSFIAHLADEYKVLTKKSKNLLVKFFGVFLIIYQLSKLLNIYFYL